MQLRHLKTLQQPNDHIARITALCWSPNNRRLAAATSDRVVHLFDELGEKKDKFSTKPADAKGPKNYMVTGMAFSPDSTKLAVAQSDNIVFIYKLGLEWGEKKSICNKFLQTNAAVTCLTWPLEQPNELVFGLSDGTVRVGIIRSNKGQKLYSTESYVMSLCSSPDGHAVLSGHVDGSIWRFSFEDSGGPAHVKLATHTCVPQSLAWGENIVAAGSDGKVVFYDLEGSVYQLFDYSSDIASIKEFTGACFNPSGENVVLGAYNRLHVFNLNIRRNLWEEAGVKNVDGMYSVTAMSWKLDGSRLCVGTLAGAVDAYDACLRRYRYKGKFEFTYVSLSQVIVKRLQTGTRIVLKSHFQYEIVKINIYQDQYLVAHTPETLLIGDLGTCKLSEVPWSGSGSERFIFENPAVCMVYNAGELTLVEYGRNEILGSCRTEHVSPHYISCRLNEGRPAKAPDDEANAVPDPGLPDNKKITYLMDIKTIQVLDLVTSHVLATINHDAKVDWLELNPNGTKLLFRDKLRHLHLYDIAKQDKATLLNFCSYVQWVPNSDVVVAQNRENLCVWYSIDAPERVTIFQIKGDVEDIERAGGRTEVIVDEGINTVSYRLDETLIEFGMSIENNEYERAVHLLEHLEYSTETEAMWSTLCNLALENSRLMIAERCCAALGDMARAAYLRKVIDVAQTAEAEGLQDGTSHFLVRAKMSTLQKHFDRAEQILLEQGAIDQAMEMYQELHRWDAAIAIAEAKNRPETEELKTSYLQWLLETGQEEKAALLKEKEGDIETGIRLYLQGGLPAKAAALAQNPNYPQTPEMLETIAAALSKSGLHEKAGSFMEKLGMAERALEAYRKGHAYRRAVELSRRMFPREVVTLEHEWGNWLVEHKQLDAAINHFIEAGQYVKAIEAAIQARQWSKAVQIVDMQEDDVAERYFKLIGQHFHETKHLDKAERFYIKARCPQLAVEMYTQANKWDKAYKVATTYMSEAAVGTLYVNQAQRLESAGKLKEAEKLYVMVNEPDLAINMYKKNRHYDHMIRLVAQYRKDLLTETHLHLAQQLEAENKFKDAEMHYVDSNDWKSAVNMYRAHELWDDAIRVAKSHGGVNASKQVAYAWAVSLGGEAGAKLLTKFGLIEQAIDYATESGNFEQAFHLARTSMKTKLPEVHLKHAMYLEDEGRFKEAEAEFINAKKPKEAIDMFVHQQDWKNALRIAENHDAASRTEVRLAQARAAVDKKDYSSAESIFIEVGKVDVAVKMYKDARMWEEALRVAKTHENAAGIGAAVVYQLQQETARGMSAPDPGADQDLMAAGKMWEDNGDYSKAIDSYLKVTSAQTRNVEYLEEIWEKAVELAMTRCTGRITEVVSEVSKRLVDLGRFEQAAEFFEGIDAHKDAIDVYMRAGLWDKARAVTTHAPQFASYVEQQFQQRQGGAAAGIAPGMGRNPAGRISSNSGGMAGGASAGMGAGGGGMGGAMGGGSGGGKGDGLQELAQRGDWERCLEVAKGMGQDGLDQYIGLYTTALLRQSQPEEAVHVFYKHGTPAGNLPVYRQVAKEVLGRNRSKSKVEGTWLATVQELREVLYKLWSVVRSAADVDRTALTDIERLLYCSHFVCLYQQVKGKGGAIAELEQKLATSLLRYCDILPADMLFYEAGQACKAVNKLNQAFVFTNRFLDICDAMEEADSSTMIDNADFESTDIPFDFNVPDKRAYYLNEVDREAVREWVLTLSMDQKVDSKLSTVKCYKCSAAIYEGNLSCPDCKAKFKTCAVTGFPVSRPRGELPPDDVFLHFHDGSMMPKDYVDFCVKH